MILVKHLSICPNSGTGLHLTQVFWALLSSVTLQVYAIGSFIPEHPGGFLIRRAIGEDATEPPELKFLLLEIQNWRPTKHDKPMVEQVQAV